MHLSKFGTQQTTIDQKEAWKAAKQNSWNEEWAGGKKKDEKKTVSHFSLSTTTQDHSLLHYFSFFGISLWHTKGGKKGNFHFKRVTGRNSRNKRQMYAGKQVPLTMVLIFSLFLLPKRICVCRRRPSYLA